MIDEETQGEHPPYQIPPRPLPRISRLINGQPTPWPTLLAVGAIRCTQAWDAGMFLVRWHLRLPL